MGVSKTRKAVKAKKAKLVSTPCYRGTEARLRVFLEHYGKHGRVMRACEASGIDHATHYRKLQIDPEYRARVEEAEQSAAQQLEDKVYDMAMEDELQAAVVLLKRFRPQLYRERASLDVSGSLDLVTALSDARNRMIAIDADVSKAS